MKRLQSPPALLLALLLAIPASATIYTVKPDGTGDFPTIQAAIDAPEVVDGDIIELTDGVFRGDGNHDVSYLGKAITVRSQSGDPRTCIIDCLYEGRGFRFANGEGPASILEGVTIRNGTNTFGGGVYCVSTSPRFNRCIFSNNSAMDGGGLRT